MSSAGRQTPQPSTHLMVRLAAAMARAAAVIVVVLTLVTAAFESLADPVRARLGPGASEAAVEALRRELDLDGPLTSRIVSGLGRQLRGDLAQSVALGRPVSAVVLEGWANTLLYAIPGALFALGLATSIAVMLSPSRQRRLGARMEIGLAGVAAVSGVVLAAGLQGLWGALGGPITALSLREAAAMGLDGWRALFEHALAPALTWAVLLLPGDLRVQRAALGSVQDEAWTTGLRARGLSERRVAWHVLAHASPIVIARVLQRLPQLACGSVAVEAVFDVPGLGSLMLLALRSGDVVLAQGLVVAMAVPLVALRALLKLGYEEVPRASTRGPRERGHERARRAEYDTPLDVEVQP